MNKDNRPPAIFLMGPTAAGKTAMAMALADRYPVDLISVDSALVYTGLDIGTAKPSSAMQQHYPHHLIDIRAPEVPYSAADFRDDALEIMKTSANRGKIPLLVGGTGLYFRALEHGLSSMPGANKAIRHRLSLCAEKHGWPYLHRQLADKDPEAARRIASTDAQRIQRALEVIELSGGVALTQLQQQHRKNRLPFRLLKLALVPDDRKALHANIAKRFTAMLSEGFLEEVATLAKRHDMQADLPAWRTVGYRQAYAYLTGHTNRTEFEARALAATRQLAKRQITWLRRELDARWLNPMMAGATKQITDAVDAFLGI